MAIVDFKAVANWVIPVTAALGMYMLSDMKNTVDENSTVINKMNVDVAVIKEKQRAVDVRYTEDVARLQIKMTDLTNRIDASFIAENVPLKPHNEKS